MSEAGRRLTDPAEPFPLEGGSAVGISTPPVRAALTLLREHVRGDGRTGPALPRTGGVVLVVGGPGTGKSHLLAQVTAECRRLAERHDGPPTPVSAVRIEAAGLDVGEVYRRFVRTLPRSEVVACVRAYHANLAVQLITHTDLAERAEQLLRSPDLSAGERDDYISRLGLSQTELLERLQRTLTTVVGDDAYAAAFSMLLREGLVDAAWRWLRGEPPAPVLQERGITGPVAGDPADIAYFARLYGNLNFNLVLAVDDVDQVVFAPDRDRQLPGFQQALLRLQSAGALVFLSGRPESTARLGLDRSGSGTRLLLTGFDPADVERYLRAGSRSGTLLPFEQGAVDRLVDLTGGNPRLLSELAGRLRRHAVRQGTRVSAETVLQESRRYFAVVDRPRVVSTIRRVLDNQRWEFSAEYVVAVEPVVRVDFWIPVATGPDPAGCAIVITDTVVDDTDLERLTGLADALGRSAVQVQTLVVMIGAVSAPHAARLRGVFDREPLPFVAESFDDDLAAAVKSMMQSLGEDGGGPLAGVRDRLGNLDRQQTQSHVMLKSVLDKLDELRAELAAVRGAPGSDPAPTTGRPGVVDELCGSVVEGLTTLGSPATVVRGIFALDRARDAAAQELRRALVRPDVRTAWGVLSGVTAVVEEFRAAAVSWFRTRTPSPGVRPQARELRELDDLCGRLTESLNRFPLGELEALRTVSSEVAHDEWRGRFDTVRQALNRLPDDVRGLAENVP